MVADVVTCCALFSLCVEDTVSLKVERATVSREPCKVGMLYIMLYFSTYAVDFWIAFEY